MIRFRKITIEGYRSIIDHTTYNLNAKGITRIEGENGAGKTTIFSALSWCLFGQSLKGSNNPEPWDWIKPKNYNGVYVKVDLIKDGKHYKIIRCHKFKGNLPDMRKGNSRIYVSIDNKAVNLEGKKDLKDYVANEILGCSYRLFINSILFGQKMKRLMAETGSEINKVFDELFEADYIIEAKKKAELKLKDLKLERDKQTLKISLASEKLNSAKKLQQNSLARYKADKRLKREELERITGKIEKAKQELRSLEIKHKTSVAQKDIDEVRDLIDERREVLEANSRKRLKNRNALKLLERINHEIADKRAQVDGLGIDLLSVPSKCTICSKKWPKGYLKDLEKPIKDRQNRIKIQIEKLEVEAEKYNNAIKMDIDLEAEKEILDSIKELEERLKRLRATPSKENINTKIESLNDRIKELKDDHRATKARKIKEPADYMAKIKKLTSKIDTAQTKVDKYQKDIALYEWAIKDPLSNSGIKSYVFNERLKAVNAEIKQLARFVGMKIEVYTNLEGKRKDHRVRITKQGNSIDYGDLSGGQQQLVDIAIAFGIHAVASKQIETNITLLDEPAENLSGSSCELLATVLDDMAKSKSIHLISHNKNIESDGHKKIGVELDMFGRTKISYNAL